MQWVCGGQITLFERRVDGVVHVLVDDGGPYERTMREAVDALDRGETIELVNIVTGKVLSTIASQDDCYVEKRASGVTERELNE